MQDGADASKQLALEALAAVLGASGVPYAIIGGVALQVHVLEPRTTLDIDVAVADRRFLPVAAMQQAGFSRTGLFEHTENWQGPGAVPVQFTDDPAFAAALMRTVEVSSGSSQLRVLCVEDLLLAKLRAGRDPARRQSKRMQDLTDVQTLIEIHADLAELLSAEDRALLARFFG